MASRDLYGSDCAVYTDVAAGAMGVRRLESGGIFGDKGPAIFPKTASLGGLIALLNARLLTYFLRVMPVTPISHGIRPPGASSERPGIR